MFQEKTFDGVNVYFGLTSVIVDLEIEFDVICEKCQTLICSWYLYCC